MSDKSTSKWQFEEFTGLVFNEEGLYAADPFDEETGLRIVEVMNACLGQTIENVKLATAHREACFLWESEMMNTIGEDGVGSVKQKIFELKQQCRELLEALKDSRDALVMASLIDKSNTCDRAAQKADAAIKKVEQ